MSQSISDWIDFSQKNKPQGNALAGGIFVLIASGIQVGWIFNTELQSFPFTRGHTSNQIIMTYATFYIAATIGLYLGSIVIERLTKTNIYFTAATFGVIGSIGFIAMPSSLFLVMFCRFALGLAHGYVYLTCLVHASEIMTQKLRGMIITVFNFVTISSIMLTGSFTLALDKQAHAFGSMQWMGITGIMMCAIGLIFIPIFTRESPVSLIRQKRYGQAVALMVRLRNESDETWSIKNEYNELRTMVEEDEQSTKWIFDAGNMRPLMLVTLLKIGSVLSFNYGVNMIRLKSTSTFIDSEGVNYSVILLIGVRMAAAMVTMFTIDSKGRKPHLLLSFGGSSIILIVMGVVAAYDSSSALFLVILQIVYEFFGGIGMGMIADVYASEAFNTTKKPRSILFATGVEYILQAAIIGITFNVAPSNTYSWIFLVGSGVLIMIITAFVFKQLPETAKMSIRQTRTEFLKAGEIVFSGSKMPPQSITFS